MKGIVLAGGSGTRLYPLTIGTSKQLLPIYDKPMIYYPISVLMLAGIKEILIISTPKDLPNFKKLLGSGVKFGVNFTYAEQPSPNGIAQAFLIGKEFIGKDSVCLILGDNIFFGHGFIKIVTDSLKNSKGATVFAYRVSNPSSFGVVEFDSLSRVISIEEKPLKPKSDYVITGLYFFDNDVLEIAKDLRPSDRGELEITDVNNIYLKRGHLKVSVLGPGIAWLDTGSHDSLMKANQVIYAIENSQSYKVACLEEIAYNKGWVSREELLSSSIELKNSDYGRYLRRLLK